MKSKCYTFFSALLLISCAEATAPIKVFDDYRGPTDKTYDLIRDDLYSSSDGHLYFRTSRADGWMGETQLQPVYLKRFGYYDSDFPDQPYPYLKDVVESETWRQDSSTVYSDANGVYCRHDLSSGAHLLKLEEFRRENASFVSLDPGNAFTRQLDQNSVDQSLFDGSIYPYLTNGEIYVDPRCNEVDREEEEMAFKTLNMPSD